MSKVTKFAQSPKGRELAEKAKAKANDPETKAKIQQAREKLAGKRGGDSESAGPAHPDRPESQTGPTGPGGPAV